MTNTLESIEPTLRLLINDGEKTGTDLFTYTSSPIFILTESNVNRIVEVTVNGRTSGVTYTYSTSTNKLTITSHLVIDDVVEIIYAYYANYSTNELMSYLRTALVHLSVNQYKLFVEGSGTSLTHTTTSTTTDVITGVTTTTTVEEEPTDEEANLIALIASIVINPSNISYRLPDISVAVPKDLPTLDKIRKAIAVFKKNGIGVFFIAEDYGDVDILTIKDYNA